MDKASDIILALQQQRDHALNTIVLLQAEIASLKRNVAKKDTTERES